MGAQKHTLTNFFKKFGRRVLLSCSFVKCFKKVHSLIPSFCFKGLDEISVFVYNIIVYCYVHTFAFSLVST